MDMAASLGLVRIQWVVWMHGGMLESWRSGQEDNNSFGWYAPRGEAKKYGGRGLAGSAIPSCIFTFGPGI